MGVLSLPMHSQLKATVVYSVWVVEMQWYRCHVLSNVRQVSLGRNMVQYIGIIQGRLLKGLWHLLLLWCLVHLSQLSFYPWLHFLYIVAQISTGINLLLLQF